MKQDWTEVFYTAILVIVGMATAYTIAHAIFPVDFP